ncbi:hypothetical protein ACS0TY_033108 [Phlomoides rotata]
MNGKKFDARQLLKEKRVWVAAFIAAWAAALQGHMMWLQRQESFKQKFGDANPKGDSEKPVDELLH